MNTKHVFLGISTAATCLALGWGFNACQSVSLPTDVAEAAANLPEKIDYNLHIKPILSDRCFACHGPDQNKQKAGLRLDMADMAYDHTCENGMKAIVPNNASQSDLVKRILSIDPNYVMPELQTHLTLSAQEKALLVRWIEQGAEYKPHWSLLKPKRAALPDVKNKAWVKNEIDYFVLNKLEVATPSLALMPQAEANKTTLLRRVSFDLTGLPPTPAEITQFLADRSANAYEKVVNRLLSSPHYGEHQAVAWLDLARYADTHGYQLDVMRTAWPYRDWVISAFNRNLSFDRFVTWQLAGDLLPKPQREQLIATAFNRMHPQNQEGGIVAEEYLAEYAADRVNTFGKAFLGLTVECARCHDHKYDPISQKDYYQLFAFFNNVNEAGQVPFYGESSPTLVLTTPQTEQKLKAIRAKIEQLRAPISNLGGSGRPRPTQKTPISTSLIGSYSFDEPHRSQFKNTANPKKPAGIFGDNERLPEIIPGKFGKARAVNGDGNISLGADFGYFERHEPFAISLWVNFQKAGLRGPVFSRTNGLDNGERGYECVMSTDGTLSFHLNHNYPASAIDLQTIQKMPIKQWVHLVFSYDGSGTAAGAHIYVNGKKAAVRVHADNLKKSMIYGQNRGNGFGLMLPFIVGGKFRDSMADFWIDELNVFNQNLTDDEVGQLALGKKIDKKISPADWQLNQQIAQLRAQETALYDATDEVMVMNERRHPNATHILKRGVYDAPAERVEATPPTQLPSFQNYPKNRLGLAQWLLNKDNPLFARVVVNRYWQQFFGRGLVASADDFGNQGNLPSHPELLDWLAVGFSETWNVKALQKKIVMSATYRQASTQSPKTLEIDPENVWLARGASYRLSAEQVRDNVLVASGLLNKKVGGGSVFPYQPAGVWEALAASTSSPPYPQSHGDSLYRRSLYTIWKRTAPSPSMIIFDTPERHACIIKRQKTSTPLQALITLNDPQYVEAARVLAQSSWRSVANGQGAMVNGQGSMVSGQGSRVKGQWSVGSGQGLVGKGQGLRVSGQGSRVSSQRLSRMTNDQHPMVNAQHLMTNAQLPMTFTQIFMALISRPPRPTELKLVQQLYAEELARFKQNPEQATALLSVGEFPADNSLNKSQLAALTVVCSTVMNLDEALIKR